MRTELALRKRLSEDPDVYDRLRDLMVAQEVDDLLEEINNYCEHVDINPLGLFFSEADTLSPPDAMRSFVEDLPSAYTWARLRYWKHRDLSHPWEQHDWTDISSLSVAVPYCDVIITERRWAHVIKAAGLANRFDTQVGHGLAEFESFLPR